MKSFLLFLGGALLGGVLVYFLFVGPPKAKQVPPGAPVRALDAGAPQGTVVVEFNEEHFNRLLDHLFAVGSPTFRLGAAGPRPGPDGASYVNAQEGGGCPSQIAIVREHGDVRTGVRITNNQVLAPLAFTGTFSVFGMCRQFKGTAEANLELWFDAPNQTLSGRLNVAGVTVEEMALLSGPITAFVQNVIDQRINPMPIMRPEHISFGMPVQTASGPGAARARATDVRTEIQEGKLRLHLTYDFAGAQGATPPATPPS